MKKIINTIKWATALAILLNISACKKDKVDTDTPSTGNVKIEFENKWGAGTDFELNTTHIHPTLNHDLKISTLKYYVSNIKLKKADGSWWAAPESYYLVDASNASSLILDVPNVPTGDYKELSYMIGVDSVRNTSGAQTGALATSNGMFWSWMSGYIFFKCEGNSSNSTASMGSFTYHVGGFSGANSALKTINIPFQMHTLTTTPAATPQIHITTDVSKLFGAVNVSTANNVQMPGANAAALASQFATAFELEHIHN